MAMICPLKVAVDPQPLLNQLAEFGEDLWNSDETWSKGKSLLDATTTIVLRYNKTPEGQQPGERWDRPAFSILDAAQKIVFDVMRAIPGEHLGKVMISKMHPGEKIDWHIDRMPNGLRPYWQRFQVPLHVKSGVRFCVADLDASNENAPEIHAQRIKEAIEVYMQPGTAWWFDNQRYHAVFNDSDEDRISMFCDIRPFAAPSKAVLQSMAQRFAQHVVTMPDVRR